MQVVQAIITDEQKALFNYRPKKVALRCVGIKYLTCVQMLTISDYWLMHSILTHIFTSCEGVKHAFVLQFCTSFH